MSSSSTAFSSATQETLKPKQHYGLYVVLWLCGLAVFWRTVFTGLWPDSFLNYVVPLYSFVGANLSPDDDDSDPNTIDADEQFGWMEFIGVLILVYGILVAISLKNVRIANILYKQRVWMTGVISMPLSRDFKWKKPTPHPSTIRDAKDKKKRRIVFIRHGESEWNEVFNRGFGFSFFVRLFKAMLRELSLFPTRDSVFIDASLSDEGIEQICELNEFLKDPPYDKKDLDLVQILRGDKGVDNSIIVCSNLRRAAATAAIALQRRLQATNEQIYLMSSLQEISRNVDANAISKPQEVPDLHVIDSHMYPGYSAEKVFNPEFNFGQKSLFRSNGYKRMREFCEWVFNQPKEVVIIGGGHSFYFREFFRVYLDDDDHHSNHYIMRNGGTVTFVLESAPVGNQTYYRIPEESVKEVYSGHRDHSSAFKLPVTQSIPELKVKRG